MLTSYPQWSFLVFWFCCFTLPTLAMVASKMIGSPTSLQERNNMLEAMFLKYIAGKLTEEIISNVLFFWARVIPSSYSPKVVLGWLRQPRSWFCVEHILATLQTMMSRISHQQAGGLGKANEGSPEAITACIWEVEQDGNKREVIQTTWQR